MATVVGLVFPEEKPVEEAKPSVKEGSSTAVKGKKKKAEKKEGNK